MFLSPAGSSNHVGTFNMFKDFGGQFAVYENPPQKSIFLYQSKMQINIKVKI